VAIHAIGDTTAVASSHIRGKERGDRLEPFATVADWTPDPFGATSHVVFAAAASSKFSEHKKEFKDPYAPQEGGALSADEWCHSPNVYDVMCEANPAAVTLED
jgi:hypothetical protein